ncbi:MAG: hypothetical protein AB1540_17260 [Bdellovibrionota bacterium]
MGGLPYHRGVRLDDSLLKSPDGKKLFLKEPGSNSNTRNATTVATTMPNTATTTAIPANTSATALVPTQKTEMPIDTSKSIRELDDTIKERLMARYTYITDDPPAPIKLQELNTVFSNGEIEPELALDYVLQYPNRIASDLATFNLFNTTLSFSKTVTPEQLEKILDLTNMNEFTDMRGFTKFSGTENSHLFRSFSADVAKQPGNRKYFWATHFLDQSGSIKKIVRCVLLGAGALVGLCGGAAESHPIGIAGMAILYTGLRMYLAGHSFGRMNPQTDLILAAVDKLATAPSEELVHKLAARMTAPAEVYELFWRLAERFPDHFVKPPTIDETRRLDFWNRRRFSKDFEKEFDPKKALPLLLEEPKE